MDEQGLPTRRRWVEASLVAVVLADAAFTALTSGVVPVVLGQSALIALMAPMLLLRHRHWAWLMPLMLVVNAVAGALTILVICSYGFATRSHSRVATILVGALAIAGAAFPAVWIVDAEWRTAAIAVVALVVAASVAMGMYAQARRQLMAQFRKRAEDAERDRASAEEAARRSERTRIAREMHDIVAHKISLVALQAGALEVNPNLEREQVVESAALIRQTATTALSELREVLGVLRRADDRDDGPPLAPQPTWEDVRALVASSQEAGITVELFDFIDDPVPDPLARTAYRVVQEGLTNIHKHARHTRARVALIGEPGTELIIEISNVLPVGAASELPGARMGLSGIETRVLHAGGTITSGPTEDGRFEVKAVIPWPATT